VLPDDYLRRRALWLPESARYDSIMEQAAVRGADLPKLITEAINDDSREFYGNLGQDVIKQFDKMTLDLKNMQLIFQ